MKDSLAAVWGSSVWCSCWWLMPDDWLLHHKLNTCGLNRSRQGEVTVNEASERLLRGATVALIFLQWSMQRRWLWVMTPILEYTHWVSLYNSSVVGSRFNSITTHDQFEFPPQLHCPCKKIVRLLPAEGGGVLGEEEQRSGCKGDEHDWGPCRLPCTCDDLSRHSLSERARCARVSTGSHKAHTNVHMESILGMGPFYTQDYWPGSISSRVNRNAMPLFGQIQYNRRDTGMCPKKFVNHIIIGTLHLPSQKYA